MSSRWKAAFHPQRGFFMFLAFSNISNIYFFCFIMPRLAVFMKYYVDAVLNDIELEILQSG